MPAVKTNFRQVVSREAVAPRCSSKGTSGRRISESLPRYLLPRNAQPAARPSEKPGIPQSRKRQFRRVPAGKRLREESARLDESRESFQKRAKTGRTWRRMALPPGGGESTARWWARQNSNLRPLPCQGSEGQSDTGAIIENQRLTAIAFGTKRDKKRRNWDKTGHDFCDFCGLPCRPLSNGARICEACKEALLYATEGVRR